MDQAITWIGVVSGVLGIIGYFLPINSTRARWFHGIYAGFIALFVGIATHKANQLDRINNIARQADALVESKQMHFTNRGYVFAALAFLEKHKDDFPDTYMHAQKACQQFKCDDPQSTNDMVELSFTLDGIIKGIGTMSKP